MGSEIHPFNSTSSAGQSVFNGFSHVDICHVPQEIWEILTRQGSYSIQVNDDTAFDLLEEFVCQMYGSPQNMTNNGRIYRGQASNSNDCAGVVLTFYKSTLLVRVQGSGYALWVNKTLPLLANKLMDRLTELRCNTAPNTPPKTPVSQDISTTT